MPDAPAGPGRRRRWVKPLLIAVLLVAGLIAAPNVYLMRSTRGAIVTGVETAPVRPYAIVLGNRVFAGGVPSGELAMRLATALELYRNGRARKVVVSGLARGAYNEPDAMAAWLQTSGVPRADIILDPGGHRTAATMANAVALGVREALIVSQGYHLPRAVYLARHAGIDAIGVPARSGSEDWDTSFRFLVRETMARAEIVVEVALRGVR
jgi:SanA protein